MLKKLIPVKQPSTQEKEEKPKILVIDDSPDVTQICAQILSDEGFKVDVAHRGRQALSMLKEKDDYDVLIVDFALPDISGLDLLHSLERDIPAILISGYLSESEIETISRLEGLAFLRKPFPIKELVARCRSVLAMSGRDDQESLSSLRREIKRLRRQRQELLHRINILKEQERQGEMQTISLGELGALVSGIVHDLRGGLGVIRNTAGFALDNVDRNDPLATDLRKIVQSAEFCEVIIRNLMALGGGEAFEPTEINIEMMFREVFFMLERKLVDVNLVVDADLDTPTIMADEGQMKQVFMNLIKNAGEAMPDGGTLTLRTRREGQMLRIEVSDTGCGIPPENQQRLFQEFFTTKDRGYGLGLHIVNTIVKRHGGTIAVESKVGGGTTFTLHLPIESE